MERFRNILGWEMGISRLPTGYGLVTDMTLMPLELRLLDKSMVRKCFDTGFIVIRWILGCDLPMHKSGLGQNEAGVGAFVRAVIVGGASATKCSLYIDLSV